MKELPKDALPSATLRSDRRGGGNARSSKRKRLTGRAMESHGKHHRASAELAGSSGSKSLCHALAAGASTHGSTSSRLQNHVCMLWVDNANIVRCRMVPRARFERGGGGRFQLNLTNAVQSVPCHVDAPLDHPVGEVRLVPDLASLVRNANAFLEDTSVCFGFMDQNGCEWNQCPRTFLQKQENLLREKFQLRSSIGFEMEFVLLHKDSHVPIDSSLYCELRAFHTNTTGWIVLKRIVEVLHNHLDIPVWQYHAEAGSGQFEISLGPFNAPKHASINGTSSNINANGTHAPQWSDMSLVQAVDKLILARQTVHHVASQFGLVATFLPKFRANEAGSASHFHLGLLDQDNTNLFQSQQEFASQFLAGVVHKLPSMSMLLASTMNSYERLLPRCWAGAFQCFGFENREAPIRLISTDNSTVLQRVLRIEVKTVDATANPYVALGAILASGMHGMDHNLPLPEPCKQDPANLPDNIRPPALPRSLQEAIETFENDRGFWDQVLTEPYCDLLLRLRKTEHEYFAKLKPSERLQELLKRF